VGISEALKLMTAGEKRRIWIPADLTFREGQHARMMSRPEEMEAPPHQDLTADVELVAVLKSPAAPPDLKTPPLNALHTASGLAYRVIAHGSGTAHPAPNSTVKMHFTGWTNDGRLFESTMMTGHPALVPLAGVMPGLREGLTYMTVGEKTRFWIPAALAYGEHPAIRFNPAGDLIYEIELLSVQ
jgi:FKBP-type peptidyl-prolyl cis-trans isomerase